MHAVISEVKTLECYFTAFPTNECIQGEESTLVHYASTVSDLRKVPFNKFLFSPRGKYFDASAKQLRTYLRRRMPIKRLREICSRYISWGECHFNIVRRNIEQSRCFSRTLRSIRLIRNSTCSLRSLVLR